MADLPPDDDTTMGGDAPVSRTLLEGVHTHLMEMKKDMQTAMGQISDIERMGRSTESGVLRLVEIEEERRQEELEDRKIAKEDAQARRQFIRGTAVGIRDNWRQVALIVLAFIAVLVTGNIEPVLRALGVSGPQEVKVVHHEPIPPATVIEAPPVPLPVPAAPAPSLPDGASSAVEPAQPIGGE